MIKSVDDYFFMCNRPSSMYEETHMLATIAGLNFKPFPPLDADYSTHFCFAVDNNQPAEYATFEEISKRVRAEWKAKMLEYGAPKDSEWYWSVACPIGKEKWFFENEYDFPDDISSFLEGLPLVIPIDWVKIIEFANEYKKEWKENNPDKKVIYDKQNKLKEPSKKEKDTVSVLCKQSTVTIADVCDGFDIDRI